MSYFPLHAADCYKIGHPMMHPKDVVGLYSNFTARSSNLFPTNIQDDKTVFVGFQSFLIELQNSWETEFFQQPLEKVLKKYTKRVESILGPGACNFEHIESLHKLGFLPVRIKALPEGSRVNIGIPYFTIMNTVKGFGWLVGYLEDVLSCENWKPITAATIAYEAKQTLLEFAEATGGDTVFCNLQGHDFSLRGMSGVADAARTGIGHLSSFWGTDTIPAIDYIEEFYGCKGPIGLSVPATEHSVMCLGGEKGEFETYRRLIEDQYPKGIISIVSDTWDYFNVLTVTARALKDSIEARQPDAMGLCKVVFRPDSGKPIDIICGDLSAPAGSPEAKGSLECLWEVFGGTVNSKGFKVLNPKVGLIYGDGINLSNMWEILHRMETLGWCSSNIVFGLGSFTYQYITRDSLGMAMKATANIVQKTNEDGMVDEFVVPMQKNPKTSDGLKKSANGLLKVTLEGDDYVLHQNVTPEEEEQGELRTIWQDGTLLIHEDWDTIRSRIWKGKF